MRGALTTSRARRGLVVSLDGLAIWLLSVVLAAYTTAAAARPPGAGVVATAAATTASWIATPGVGGFELLGYVGLAVAVAGPGWYWLVKPGLAGLETGSLRPWSGDDESGFQFGHEQATGAVAEAVRSRQRSTGVYDIDLGAPDDIHPAHEGVPRRRTWVPELFDDGPLQRGAPAGDFYRGGGSKPAPNDDAANEVETDDGSGRELEWPTTSDVLVANGGRTEGSTDDAGGSVSRPDPDHGSAAGDGSATADESAAGDGSAAGDVLATADGIAIEPIDIDRPTNEPSAESGGAASGTLDEPMAGPPDRPSVVPLDGPADGSTDRPPAGSGDRTDGRPAERPADHAPDPVDRLANQLAASRAALETVSDRISRASDGPVVEAAADAFTADVDVDGELAPRSIAADRPAAERSLRESVDRLRADARLIESAFAAKHDVE